MTPTTPAGAPKKTSTLTILLIVLGVGGIGFVCCLGTLAAIAVPNFMKFQGRSKQGEVKSNLKAAFYAEKSWFAERDTYSESLEEVGFMPERPNRYMYVLAPGGDALVSGAAAGGAHSRVEADSKFAPDNVALLAAIPAALLAQTGVHGTCPDSCNITIVAVGNVDEDADVDLWSISTEARTIDGTPVPAGQPFNHHSDI